MRTRNEPKIYDIARALNLSTSTIRRALNGSEMVREQTRSRIEQVAVALGYRQDGSTAKMKTEKSRVLGALVTHLNSTIASCVLSGAESTAAQMGHSVIIHQSMNNSELRSRNVGNLINQNVDGVLVTSAFFQESESIDGLTALNIPVVVVEASSLLPSRPKKKVSDFQNAFELTNYLIENGCREIAYVAEDLNSPRHINLLSGCKEALSNNNLPEPQTLLSKVDDTQNFWSSISDLLLSASPRPDGIFFASDTVTALAYTPLESPAGNDELFVTWRKGSVSSQNQMLVEIGKLAAALLIYLSERKSKSPVTNKRGRN